MCIKTAWNRVRNMFATVLTTITTIWTPGLTNCRTIIDLVTVILIFTELTFERMTWGSLYNHQEQNSTIKLTIKCYGANPILCGVKMTHSFHSV